MLVFDRSVSVTELKKSPAVVLRQAEGRVVAVLNHNRPEAYLVPMALYQRMVEIFEDLEDSRLVLERRREPAVEVSIDEL